ncbi:MAG: hypothetical protein ACTSV2_11840, partial [Candidatus Thorarchaeota archaeon]
MKLYQMLIGVAFVVVILGLQVPVTTNTGGQFLDDPLNRHMAISDLTPYEIALVWSNATGSQIVDVVTGNFDGDSRTEVAVITQNGTLVIYDDNNTRIRTIDIGSTPYSLDAILADAGTVHELLIGTDDGFVVIRTDS